MSCSRLLRRFYQRTSLLVLVCTVACGIDAPPGMGALAASDGGAERDLSALARVRSTLSGMPLRVPFLQPGNTLALGGASDGVSLMSVLGETQLARLGTAADMAQGARLRLSPSSLHWTPQVDGTLAPAVLQVELELPIDIGPVPAPNVYASAELEVACSGSWSKQCALVLSERRLDAWSVTLVYRAEVRINPAVPLSDPRVEVRSANAWPASLVVRGVPPADFLGTADGSYHVTALRLSAAKAGSPPAAHFLDQMPVDLRLWVVGDRLIVVDPTGLILPAGEAVVVAWAEGGSGVGAQAAGTDGDSAVNYRLSPAIWHPGVQAIDLKVVSRQGGVETHWHVRGRKIGAETLPNCRGQACLDSSLTCVPAAGLCLPLGPAGLGTADAASNVFLGQAAHAPIAPTDLNYYTDASDTFHRGLFSDPDANWGENLCATVWLPEMEALGYSVSAGCAALYADTQARPDVMVPCLSESTSTCSAEVALRPYLCEALEGSLALSGEAKKRYRSHCRRHPAAVVHGPQPRGINAWAERPARYSVRLCPAEDLAYRDESAYLRQAVALESVSTGTDVTLFPALPTGSGSMTDDLASTAACLSDLGYQLLGTGTPQATPCMDLDRTRAIMRVGAMSAYSGDAATLTLWMQSLESWFDTWRTLDQRHRFVRDAQQVRDQNILPANMLGVVDAFASLAPRADDFLRLETDALGLLVDDPTVRRGLAALPNALQTGMGSEVDTAAVRPSLLLRGAADLTLAADRWLLAQSKGLYQATASADQSVYLARQAQAQRVLRVAMQVGNLAEQMTAMALSGLERNAIDLERQRLATGMAALLARQANYVPGVQIRDTLALPLLTPSVGDVLRPFFSSRRWIASAQGAIERLTRAQEPARRAIDTVIVAEQSRQERLLLAQESTLGQLRSLCGLSVGEYETLLKADSDQPPLKLHQCFIAPLDMCPDGVTDLLNADDRCLRGSLGQGMRGIGRALSAYRATLTRYELALAAYDDDVKRCSASGARTKRAMQLLDSHNNFVGQLESRRLILGQEMRDLELAAQKAGIHGGGDHAIAAGSAAASGFASAASSAATGGPLAMVIAGSVNGAVQGVLGLLSSQRSSERMSNAYKKREAANVRMTEDAWHTTSMAGSERQLLTDLRGLEFEGLTESCQYDINRSGRGVAAALTEIEQYKLALMQAGAGFSLDYDRVTQLLFDFARRHNAIRDPDQLDHGAYAELSQALSHYIEQQRRAVRDARQGLGTLRFESQKRYRPNLALADAMTPAELSTVVAHMNDYVQEVGDGAKRHLSPQPTVQSVSLRRDVLKVPEIAAALTQRYGDLSEDELFQRLLQDPAYARFNSRTGLYEGQAYTFSLTPQLLDRCGEQLGKIWIELTTANEKSYNAAPKVRIEKAYASASQHCGVRMDDDDTEARLESMTWLPQVGFSADGKVQLEPQQHACDRRSQWAYAVGLVNEHVFDETMRPGSAVRAFVGQGLFGDYTLMLPASQFGGAQLGSIRDVKIRVEYVDTGLD